MLQEALQQLIEKGDRPDLQQPTGVVAAVQLHEGEYNAGEDSFAGITGEAWHEFLTYLTKTNGNDKERGISLTRSLVKIAFDIERPYDFTTLADETRPEVQAKLVQAFYFWYFQRPPKQDYFILPRELWYVVCDASALAWRPVNRIVQALTHQYVNGKYDEDAVDGIWGSGTNELVKVWHDATPEQLQWFVANFTERVNDRYTRIVEANPGLQENLDGWIARTHDAEAKAVEANGWDNEIDWQEQVSASDQPETDVSPANTETDVSETEADAADVDETLPENEQATEQPLEALERTQDDSEGSDTETEAETLSEADSDVSMATAEEAEATKTEEHSDVVEVLVDQLASALAQRFEAVDKNISMLNEKIEALGNGVIATNESIVDIGEQMQSALKGVIEMGQALPDALAEKVGESLPEALKKKGIDAGDLIETAANAIANPASLPLNIARKLLQ